ncbi:MAG: hypothetical protein NC177_01170 [Ruminococcus flavefaciens]|nr:hypothetical protein [Ruminococcus flavefaciens]
MKKLASILMSVCMLTTVCGLTGCGGEKWEYAEDEGVSVSNSNCSDIVSDKAKENIREKLKDKYEDVKPKVNEESVKGLLKEEITLEKDGDYYFAENVRAEELDSIFEVNGHTAETYVDVSLEEDFMEYEIYAEYSGDTYCFAEVDFISPEYYANREAEEKKRREEEAEQKRKEAEQKRKEEEAEQKRKEEEQKCLEEKMGEYKYKDMVDEDSYYSEDTIKALEKKFKNATLTVTEDCIQLIDYEFPIELNPYEDSLSEKISIPEIQNIFDNNYVNAQCMVKNNEVVVTIRSATDYRSGHSIILTFVKQ